MSSQQECPSAHGRDGQEILSLDSEVRTLSFVRDHSALVPPSLKVRSLTPFLPTLKGSKMSVYLEVFSLP